MEKKLTKTQQRALDHVREKGNIIGLHAIPVRELVKRGLIEVRGDDSAKVIVKNPTRRRRRKNPPGPFKVVIKAIAKRGPKTAFWFNAVHKKFTTSKIGRAKFSSIGNAEIMARHLLKKYTELRRYRIELHRAAS